MKVNVLKKSSKPRETEKKKNKSDKVLLEVQKAILNAIFKLEQSLHDQRMW